MTTIEQSTQAGSLSPYQTKTAIFSVDDHVLEHPEVWTSRMSTRWGDRIPQLQSDATTGSDFWAIDGRRFPLRKVAEVGALRGDRTVGPERWHDVDTAAYVPDARLEAMDVDSVTDSVLYPLVAGVAGQRFATIADPAFETACVAAYNDYIIDEWCSKSARFIGQALVPLGDIHAAVAEIARSIERGHRGVVFPGNPSLLRSELPHVNEPHWDPIWQTCAELGVPIAIHSGSSRRIEMPPHVDYSPGRAAALEAITRPVSSAFLLNNLLWSGILVRFPELKVVFAEATAAYAAFILETAEHSWRLQGKDRWGLDVSPAEQFRRQVYVAGWYDRTGFETRYRIGVENILWSTNFPQSTSPWPDSALAFEAAAAGVPGDERADILQNNARGLYRDGNRQPNGPK